PHGCIKSLPAAVAPSSERWKVSPVSSFDCFFDSIDGRHDDDERTGIQRMLDFAFVRVCDAHTWNSFGVGTRSPHSRDGVPIAGIVLHLRPYEVVSRVGHRAVDRRIGRVEECAARNFAALGYFKLHGIPYFRALRRIERSPVLPGCGIEWPLIHSA